MCVRLKFLTISRSLCFKSRTVEFFSLVIIIIYYSAFFLVLHLRKMGVKPKTLVGEKANALNEKENEV